MATSTGSTRWSGCTRSSGHQDSPLAIPPFGCSSSWRHGGSKRPLLHGGLHAFRLHADGTPVDRRRDDVEGPASALSTARLRHPMRQRLQALALASTQLRQVLYRTRTRSPRIRLRRHRSLERRWPGIENDVYDEDCKRCKKEGSQPGLTSLQMRDRTCKARPRNELPSKGCDDLGDGNGESKDAPHDVSPRPNVGHCCSLNYSQRSHGGQLSELRFGHG